MSYTGEDGKDVHLRLMDQVKPHWMRLAIALKFPQHEIANIASEDDPVYYLFTEWLRGANQEKDPRPVTWGTLITALRDANIQQEANVLEKHFIGDNPAHVAVSQQGELIVDFCMVLYVLISQQVLCYCTCICVSECIDLVRIYTAGLSIWMCLYVI